MKLIFLETHPQYVAVVVNDFICFGKMIDNVRFGAVVNGEVGLPDLGREIRCDLQITGCSIIFNSKGIVCRFGVGIGLHNFPLSFVFASQA